MNSENISVGQKNKEYYDLFGKSFSTSRHRMRWPEIDLVRPFIQSDDSVLDLGCGNGRLLDHIDIPPTHYLGIDFSEELIAQARRLHPQHTFVVHDITHLDTLVDSGRIARRSFAVVCMIAALHHLDKHDHLAVLKSIHALLKNEGILFMTNWNVYRDPPLKKTNVVRTADHIDWHIPAEANRVAAQRVYYGFTCEELDDLLKKAGFVVEKRIPGATTRGQESVENLVHIARKIKTL